MKYQIDFSKATEKFDMPELQKEEESVRLKTCEVNRNLY